jgi:hypothetical protein
MPAIVLNSPGRGAYASNGDYVQRGFCPAAIITRPESDTADLDLIRSYDQDLSAEHGNAGTGIDSNLGSVS